MPPIRLLLIRPHDVLISVRLELVERLLVLRQAQHERLKHLRAGSISRYSWLLLMLSMISACANLHSHKELSSAKGLPLAVPLGPPRQVMQQIQAEWPGRSETLLCALELDSQHIAMAGLSPDGMSLFNMDYDGHKLQLDKSPLIPDNLQPQLFISDLQLIYWPLLELETRLPVGWHFETTANSRSLYHEDEKQAEVQYLSTETPWPKTVILINHIHNYRLHITTLSYDVLPE